MGIFDDAISAINDGANKLGNAVDGAVSGVAIEKQPFMKGFIRLCNDGWEQGWHERNGGNLTYLLSGEELENCRSYLDFSNTNWVSMGVHADNLRGAFFVTTGAGKYMRNVAQDPLHNLGIVQINDAGDSWRIVWGLRDGGVPTSEFPSHFLIHSVRMQATGGANKVLYHAHPDNVVALTKILPLDAREITRALWKSMTECIIAFPGGVGVVEWMVPGGAEIAKATSELMKTYDAVIWAQHGLFSSGPDFDNAFGLMHTIEKASRIYLTALSANGGSKEFLNTISDAGLRQIGRELNLKINEQFLD